MTLLHKGPCLREPGEGVSREFTEGQDARVLEIQQRPFRGRTGLLGSGEYFGACLNRDIDRFFLC